MMPYDTYREVQIRCEEIRSQRIAADIRRGQLAAAVSRMLRPRTARPARSPATGRLSGRAAA
jgi:hypothetical protein